MYMLKSVGDSTPPCGILILNRRCVDVLFPNVAFEAMLEMCVTILL